MTPQRAAPMAQETQNESVLLEKVAEFYHRALLRGSQGLKELDRLALEDEHLVEQFRLGHCDGAMLGLLQEGDTRREELRRLGLAAETAGVLTERLTGHLIVPLADAQGGVTALWGLNTKTGATLMAPADACCLWNLKAARLYPEILLCASVLDGLSLTRAGLPNVLALAGTELRGEDVVFLKSLGVQKVVAIAGREIIKRLRPRLCCLQFEPMVLARKESLNARLVASGPDELVRFVDSRLKTTPPEPLPVAAVGGQITATFGTRQYALCGIERGPRRLRATLRTECHGKLHVDTLDFYNARCRKTLAQDLCRLFEEAADVIETDIGRLVRLCEIHQRGKAVDDSSCPITLTRVERVEAEAFGRRPDILEQIAADFDACGLVGERSNKLISYLAAVSRKLDDPLSVLILSSSGAGKTAMQDAALAFCPPEDMVKLTRLTGKALFYKGRTSLKHKVLAVEEGAGVEDAAYAIRTLVSAKELVIEAAVKDFTTGRITTMENRVEGPTAVFITTTDPDVDPETRSRFIVLTVDESREQTRAILAAQRRLHTLAGVTGRESVESVLRRHRNFQRLLRPLVVVNPFAEELAYPDDRLQSRRDHPKLLNLIRAMAFLRQMQREVKRLALRDKAVEPALRTLGEAGYIEVTRDDIAAASRLMEEACGPNPEDLNGVSWALLGQIGTMVSERFRALRASEVGGNTQAGDIQFTRRDIREFTGWSHNRVKRYIKELVELEFVVADAGRFGATYRYRLVRATSPETNQPDCHLAPTWPQPSQGAQLAQPIQSQQPDRQPGRQPER